MLKTTPPTTAEGIEKYLGAGMMKGSAQSTPTARRRFGVETFDIIDATPERLREVPGIGPIRAGGKIAAWAEQRRCAT